MYIYWDLHGKPQATVPEYINKRCRYNAASVRSNSNDSCWKQISIADTELMVPLCLLCGVWSIVPLPQNHTIQTVNGRIEDVGTTEAENTVMLATGRRLIMRLAA
jgi:hypothetical protein